MADFASASEEANISKAETFGFWVTITVRYWQDCIAKNQEPISNWLMAIARVVDVLHWSKWKIEAGIAFYCFVGPSSCEYID